MPELQVADMAVGGEDLEVLAEVFLDGAGLGRRFNDDELHDVVRKFPTRIRTREGGVGWERASSRPTNVIEHQ
jgi:hypothetical protein